MVTGFGLCLAGTGLIGGGAWTLARSALPAWMKGIWRWPLGTRSSPEIARLIGWSSLLIGLSCAPTILVLALWDRSFETWLASLIAMVLVGGGSFALAWGISMSHAGES
jgi:hypothetical protein